MKTPMNVRRSSIRIRRGLCSREDREGGQSGVEVDCMAGVGVEVESGWDVLTVGVDPLRRF